MTFSIPVARLVAQIGVDGETSAASKLVRFGGVVDKTSAQQVAGFQKVGAAAKATDQQLVRFGSGAVQGMSQVGSALTRYVSIPLGLAGAAAIKTSVDFGTAFGHIGGLAGVPRAQLQGLRDDVLALAGETAQSPQKLAEAMYFITSAGIKAADATGVLRASAEAATAGLGDVQTVSQAVVSAVNAYANTNLTAAQATDIMTGTVRAASFEADQLAQSMGIVLPIASSLGVGFNEVGAALAVMSQGGISASEGVTALRSIMQQILKPAQDSQLLWEKMFGSMDNVRRVLADKGLLVLLQQLKEKTGGSQEAFAKLFPDVRGLTGLMSILGQDSAKVKAIFGDLANTTGDTHDAFKTMMDTVGGDVKQGFAEMQVALIRIGDAAGPAVSGLATGLGAVASAADRVPDPILNAGLALGALAIAAGPGLSAGAALIRTYTTLGRGIGALRGMVAGTAATMSTATAATVASGSATEVAAVAAARATGAQVSLSEATTLSAAANARLDAAIARLVVAEEGDAVAALEVSKAHDAATAALVRQQLAAERAAIATSESAAASAAANTTSAGAQLGVGSGAALGGGSRGIASALGPITLIATASFGLAQVLRGLGSSARDSDSEIKKLADDLLKGGNAADKAQRQFAQVLGPDAAIDLQKYGDALVSGAAASDLTAEKSKILQQALANIPGYLEQVAAGGENAARANNALAPKILAVTLETEHATKALRDLVDEFGAGAVQSAQLGAAQKQLRDDLASGAASATGNARAQKRLADDKRSVFNASKAQAQTENVVTNATNRGAAAASNAADASLGAAGAIDISASSATKGAYAYLGLADSVNTAADALAAISGRAFAPVVANIAVDTSTTGVDQALQDLYHPDTGSADSGGGGASGGQTATAAALEHTGKELALRDALRGVESAATGVTDAETQLAQARRDNNTAIIAVRDATKNYDQVLHGVAATSKLARDAQDALTSAQVEAREQTLNVADAERELEKARNHTRLRGFDVADKERAAKASAAPALPAHQAVLAAEKNLADVRKNSPGDANAIAQAEAALAANREQEGPLHEQMVRDEVALKDARIDAKAKNEEVKRAEDALTSARITAKTKTKDLHEAERILAGTLHGFPATSAEARAAQQQLTDARIAARSATNQVTHAEQSLAAAHDQTATAAQNAARAQADLDGKLESMAGSGGGAAKAAKAMDSYQTRLNAVKTAVIAAVNDIGDADLKAGHSFGHSILAEISALEAYVNANPILRAAFAGTLQNLENQYVNWLVQQAAHQSSTLHNQGGGNQAGPGKVYRALGGPVPGSDPNGIDITAHPGEWVIQKSAVQKYGPHMMEQINAGTADIGALGAGDARAIFTSHSTRFDTKALERKLDLLIAAIGKRNSGVHVDTIVAADPDEAITKLAAHERRAYMLTDF